MSSTGWKQLKRWPSWVVLGLAVVGLLTVAGIRDSGPQTTQDRVDEISKQLACPICDGESVFESRNNASAAIRNRVEEEVTAGQLSDDEIITALQQLYGDKLSLVPKASGVDALVWVLPVAAAVCAIAGLAFTFRRWRKAGTSVPSDEDRALVESALASIDVADGRDAP